ncbi:hypothetical protein ACFVAJ_15540 [Agromyces sp. NPDC057679]|uniref:hypothetical protein n=1 Tax=Agromyces sp. NPDC057679 TaxID=3346207 RepID=UPI00367185C2
MEYSFAGLPLHVLLVHAVIVLTPLVGLLLVVLAAWPAARRVLWLPALLGAALILPLGLITVEAGKWLKDRVPEAPLIQQHTGMGEDLTPWLIALLVVAVLIAVWALVERADSRRASGGMSRGLRIGVAVVLVLASLTVAIGATVTLVRIGEAGSRAVWEGSFSEDPLER